MIKVGQAADTHSLCKFNAWFTDKKDRMSKQKVSPPKFTVKPPTTGNGDIGL